VIAFTITPVIKTKRRLGSQSLLSYRKPYIFVLCDIPAIIKPHPKMIPMQNKAILAMKGLAFSFMNKKTVTPATKNK
jgi:hypothetical protein